MLLSHPVAHLKVFWGLLVENHYSKLGLLEWKFSIRISMRSRRNNWEFKFISLYFSFIQLFSSVYKVEHGYGYISFQQEINRLILPPGGLRARHPTVELLIEYLGGSADLWIGFNHTMKILQAREGLITQRNCLLFGAFSQGLNHSLIQSEKRAKCETMPSDDDWDSFYGLDPRWWSGLSQHKESDYYPHLQFL